MDTPIAVRRRHFLAGAAAAPLGLPTSTAAQPTRPNILFIMADDLGYADLSCYGRRDYETPNLDRLAAGGLRLTHGYANSAVCSPTRMALITGRYQYRLRGGLEEPISANARGNAALGLPPGHPTLPSLLRAAGYATALVGKWHLGYLPHFSPLRSGYDRFFGTMAGGSDYFTHQDGAGGTGTEDLHEGETTVETNGYLTDLLADRAVSIIGEHARERRPFFLSLHFTAPHWPWQTPDDGGNPRPMRGLPDWEAGSLPAYAAMVRNLDGNVARVLAALETGGVAEDTIVVFTSDNGGERFSDMWPFTGKKGQLLEGGLRVPLLVRWPRRIRPGVGEQVTATMDWMPTLLAAAGAAPDPAVPPDGENLLPVLTGEAPVRSRNLFWRFKAQGQRAARIGDLKYLRIAGNEFLFDLAADVRERANLRRVRADDFARLRAAWEEWNAGMMPQAPEANSSDDDGTLLADHYGVRRGANRD